MVFSCLEEGFLPNLLLGPEGIYLVKTSMKSCHKNVKKWKNSEIALCLFSMQAETEPVNKHFGHKCGQKYPMLLRRAPREWLSSAESLAAILASENRIFFTDLFSSPLGFLGGLHTRVSAQRGCMRHCRCGEGEKEKREVWPSCSWQSLHIVGL